VSTLHADPAHPCAASDFATTPLAPSSGIVVPARATVRLSALGIDPSRWPHLTMLERLADQDGCKGAALRLSYTGAATPAPACCPTRPPAVAMPRRHQAPTCIASRRPCTRGPRRRRAAR